MAYSLQITWVFVPMRVICYPLLHEIGLVELPVLVALQPTVQEEDANQHSGYEVCNVPMLKAMPCRLHLQGKNYFKTFTHDSGFVQASLRMQTALVHDLSLSLLHRGSFSAHSLGDFQVLRAASLPVL